MKKTIHLILLILVIFLFSSVKAYGDELDDINKQLDDLKTAYNQSKAATAPLESQLQSIKNRVAFIETDLTNKKISINNGYKNLEAKKEIFDKTVAKNYIESYNNNWLSYFLANSQANEIIQNIAYQKAKADQDKVIITNIALSITDLEEKRINLEAEETKLAAIKVTLDKIVSEAKSYQTTLTSKIAALSARQQQILGQRLSALGIPLFASSPGSCSSDIGKDPGFSGAFGFFTYGVPNRVGLSQYGAFGRAKAGKNAQDILNAYYNFDSIEGEDQGKQIHVQGNGVDWTGSLEDYVKRIYEVPDSWGDQGGMEALKAQAIAARSYVLSYTNNGQNSICPTDHCQVFKTDPKGGNWESAVNQTAGQVMKKDGNAVKAWFSSTHGGYIHSSGDIGWSGTSWTKNAQDTTSSVSSFSDLKNNAYDKDSPWFYCDWGFRKDYNKTAWLKSDEVADIVNVIMLAQRDSSTNEHLYQTDESNPAGTDTWDSGRVKSELQKRGGTPFNSVSGISVDVDWGNGKVTNVHINGDSSDPNLPGDFFKTYFNLRAPANIQIVGPLYNVERN
ncbi:MAG: SpoIID/LytB domain-containing protein [bacterium]|nr:SpoIID/LytB domain-containing protein [bacterium]